MLSRGPAIANILRSGAGVRSRTGRLLSALGLVAIAPEIAAAARRSDRRSDNHGQTNDEAQGNEDDGAKQTQDEQGSDRKSDSKASAEDHNTGDKSGNSGKHDRNQHQSANDERSDQNGSDSGNGRGDSGRRDADSNSTSDESSSGNDDSHHHSGRHVHDFAQKDKNSSTDSTSTDSTLDRIRPTDSTPNHVPDTTTATPANPNVVMDHVPSNHVGQRSGGARKRPRYCVGQHQRRLCLRSFRRRGRRQRSRWRKHHSNR